MSVIQCQVPEPLPNQVLIHVKFAGLNPLDFKIRAGKLRMIRKLNFPHIMGNEVAGVACKVGGAVSKLESAKKVKSTFFSQNRELYDEFQDQSTTDFLVSPCAMV